MASASYIRKRREIQQRQRSALGVAARERKRLELAEPMRVVAEVRTSGSLGEHVIELLAGESTGPTVYVRFDGLLRAPRTARGLPGGRLARRACPT
jgi:hypothetical protein